MAVKIESHGIHAPQAVGDNAAATRAYALLADDNMAAALAACDEFTRQGFGCDVVHSADNAARAFTVRDYDLIFLNFHGTSQSAAAATRVIRSAEKNFHWPRVTVLCFASGAAGENAKDAGADEIFSKPFTPADTGPLIEKYVTATHKAPRLLHPREPVNYRALLRLCGRDDDVAQNAIAEFARQLDAGIGQVRASLATGDSALLHRAAEFLRDQGRRACSGRVQNTALFLTCLPGPGAMKSFVPGALEELATAASDLAVWRTLKLGQAAPGMKRRSAASKTTTSRMSNFPKQRTDVFAKVSDGTAAPDAS